MRSKGISYDEKSETASKCYCWTVDGRISLRMSSFDILITMDIIQGQAKINLLANTPPNVWVGGPARCMFACFFLPLMTDELVDVPLTD